MTTAEEYADFRILAQCPSGSKKNSTSYDSTNGIMRYRFTLGEVLSWNIDIDVIVGNGWTRITLKEIPRFLVDAFDFIMTDGLQLDGIFRREGNSARLNRPEVQEVYRGVRPIPSDFTVIDVCTMVKRFLKDLKPTLLNSEDVRHKLIERAKKARASCDFTLSHQDMVRMFETPTTQLSPAHLGTLGYVMRLLSRIAKHSDSHKMTTDNLAVVLVGSVFGDFMTSGGTESRKKMQLVKKRYEDELVAKKEDMGIQVAAVKLLIVNANLIALPKSHYVSSNRLHCSAHSNIRSTSAMPNIRCASVSDNEPCSAPVSSPYGGSTHVFSMAKASLNNHKQRSLTRRDSDLTHVKNMKPRETATKRSSSFLPIASLRGLRDKVFLKRNKSPSPEKVRRQAFTTTESSTYSSPFSSPVSPLLSSRCMASEADSDDEGSPVQMRDRRSGDCQVQKKGSTSSGRKSRTLTKKGNINSQIPRPTGSRRNSGSQKSFRMSPMSQKRLSASSSTTNSTLTSRSLRRFSASEQNSFCRKSVGDATPPLEKKKRNTAGGVVRRNTVDGLRARNNIPKTGPPSRRSTFWGVDTIAEEEKENYRKSLLLMEDKEKSEEEIIAENAVAAESILEMMNNQARLRRIGVAERRRRKVNCDTSDSMMVLNGSMATFDKLPVQEKKIIIGEGDAPPVIDPKPSGYPAVFATPAREKPIKPVASVAKSKIGQQLEREMRQRLDVMATPMMSRRTAGEPVTHRNPSAIPLRTLDSIGIQENGCVWVGKAQTFVSSPIPSSDAGKVKEKPKVSPILARSPIFRSPSAIPVSTFGKSQSPFNFRSKSHLTEDKLRFSQDYAALATPPRDRRPPIQNLQLSPHRPHSNLIYFTPKVQRRSGSESPSGIPRPIIRSSSTLLVSPMAASSAQKTAEYRHCPSPLIQKTQRSSVDETLFKCPFLPPMKSHEAKTTEEPKKRESSLMLSEDNSELQGFGEYNEILKTSTEDTKFSCPHQNAEARPSVTMLRSSHCGLVQSRINHFQGIERSHRVSTDLSSSGGGGGGRSSAFSQASLKSIDSASSGSKN